MLSLLPQRKTRESLARVIRVMVRVVKVKTDGNTNSERVGIARGV